MVHGRDLVSLRVRKMIKWAEQCDEQVRMEVQRGEDIRHGFNLGAGTSSVQGGRKQD
jgi:hypothetical protein